MVLPSLGTGSASSGPAEIEERRCAQHGSNLGQVIIWCPLKWVVSLSSGSLEKAECARERMERSGTPPPTCFPRAPPWRARWPIRVFLPAP